MRRTDTEAEQRDDSERYTAISPRQPCRVNVEVETAYREAGRAERQDGAEMKRKRIRT